MVTLSKNISTTLKTKQGDITEDEVTFHWGQGEGLLTLQIILLHTTSVDGFDYVYFSIA